MSRFGEIIGGVRWALRFSNPLEILAARHGFRRKRAVIIQDGGMQMLIDSTSSDTAVITEVFLDGMYDAALREAGAGRREFRYLNLGANIGAFDLRCFQLLGPACGRLEGFAVEMNPAAHARLVLNLELNRLYSVRAINAAVWDAPGVIQVRLDERDTGQRCETAAGGSPVPLLPWRELFAQASAAGPIDLLKIDIEGAEEKVVPQLTAQDAAGIRCIVMETHGAAVRDRVLAHLGALGFRLLREEPGPGQTHLGFWRHTAPLAAA